MSLEKANKNEAKKKNNSIKAKKRRSYKTELIAKNEEFETLKDQHLRAFAEFDNYKKRREQQLSGLIENANTSLIEEILPILDDFDRSLNSNNKIKRADKSFHNGIEIIINKFKSILEKFGITEIEAIGQKFDPELHDALMQMDGKDKPSNIVLEEAGKGYKFKDKVIRPTKVIVSK